MEDRSGKRKPIQFGDDGELLSGAFCVKCGALNPSGAIRCQKCGDILAEQYPERSTRLTRFRRDTSGTDKPEKGSPRSRRLSLNLIVVLLVVLFIGLIIAARQAVITVPQPQTKTIVALVGTSTAAPLTTSTLTVMATVPDSPTIRSTPKAIVPSATAFPIHTATPVVTVTLPPPTARATVSTPSPVITPLVGFDSACWNNLASKKDKIAFAWTEEAFSKIYVASVDGTTICNIATGYPDSNDEAPGWSPDGKSLVFVSDRDHTEFGEAVYIMNFNGFNIRRLFGRAGVLNARPVWSPDGKSIAFISQQEGAEVFDLYAINANGSNLRRLISKPLITWPTWSPDSKKLMFGSMVGYGKDRTLYMIDADGKNEQALTKINTKDISARWSPDGKSIAVISGEETSTLDLYVMSSNGSNVRRITYIGIQPVPPSWSPDGRKIAIADNNDRLQIVDVETRNVQPVINSRTSQPLNTSIFAWSPN